MADTNQAEAPARRFLHICYCCDNDLEVADFLVEAFDLRQVMRTVDDYGPGYVLGMEGQTHSVGNFVYDRRGPRTSPAVEVQGWYDPTPTGEPSTDPLRIGIKALGFAVPSVDEALDRLGSMGCTTVANTTSPISGRQATVLDPRSVTLEVVEDTSLEPGESQIRHLRINAKSIEESIPFYEMLGFAQTSRGEFTDGAFAGVEGQCHAEYVTMRLPDEPFEVQLIQWKTPASHGEHYEVPYHRGLFRTALGVDDTRAAYEELTSRGAVFDRAPMSVALSGTKVPDMWIAFISDPNGIAYEFVQRPRSIFR